MELCLHTICAHGVQRECILGCVGVIARDLIVQVGGRRNCEVVKWLAFVTQT